MTDKIDMSLDDIIKKNKGARRGGAGGKRGRGGKVAGGRGTRAAGKRGAVSGRGRSRSRSVGGGGRRRSVPRGNSDGQWSHDLFNGSRRGGVATTGGPAKLIVSNLDYGVSDSDINELFNEFGKLKAAAVHYDRAGNSLGTADVVFDRKSDAIKAMKQYNGVPLDGRAMTIQLATSDLNGSAPSSPRKSGTPRGVKRTPSAGRRRSSGRVEKPGRGGGAKRGRGGRRNKSPAPSAEDLDKELDTYLKAR